MSAINPNSGITPPSQPAPSVDSSVTVGAQQASGAKNVAVGEAPVANLRTMDDVMKNPKLKKAILMSIATTIIHQMARHERRRRQIARG